MRKLLHYYDKILLALCVVLFLASAVWAMMSFRRIEEVAALSATGPAEPAAYEPHPVEMPQISLVTWPEPPAQSAPRRWVYDAFTPPVIYYNDRTREFTDIQPETNTAVAVVQEVPFEVELVSVSQEQYRIQLKGYVGNASDYLGQFENIETGDVLLARQGREFDRARGDFSVRSFEVRRVTTRSQDSMDVLEEVGFATILDNRTGREVTLTTREPLMLPRLQCVLRTRTYPEEKHILREGMKVTVNGYEYQVTQLAMNPAQAVVYRRDPRQFTGESRTLFPVAHTGLMQMSAPDDAPALARQFHRLDPAFHVSD